MQKVPKVVGRKGLHQVGQATSRERGELLTNVGIIGSDGRALPLIWVFPRMRFDEKRMMRGVPPNTSLGLVHKSGWMTTSNFLEVLKFFVKHVRSTKDVPVLLVLDNHDSHLSIEGLDYCKENGVIMLTLPPHTSNKLQPLDRCVFGPFKTFVSQLMNTWMMDHPGQTLTIYDLPEICTKGWDRAATPVNIKSAFKCTGIEPYDRDIFTDQDFLCSYVTDRPLPQEINEPVASTSASPVTPSLMNSPPPSPEIPINGDGLRLPDVRASTSAVGLSSENSESKIVTPEMIKPFPKAKPRTQTNRRGRPRGKCMIATDTPEKQEIENRQKSRSIPKTKIQAAKRDILQSSSEEEDRDQPQYTEESDGPESSGNEEAPTLQEFNTEDLILEGDFLLVKFATKMQIRHYVAKVLKINGGYDMDVTYYRRKGQKFHLPHVPDTSSLDRRDVVAKLPMPKTGGGTARAQRYLVFDVDFGNYKVM